MLHFLTKHIPGDELIVSKIIFFTLAALCEWSVIISAYDCSFAVIKIVSVGKFKVKFFPQVINVSCARMKVERLKCLRFCPNNFKTKAS